MFVYYNIKNMTVIQDIIETNAEILAGKPVFRGIRVAISTFFDYLEISSINDFLEGYPTVSR